MYVKTEYGEQTSHLASREQLEQGQAFVKKYNDQDAADRVALGNVRYDLVGKLVEKTGLTCVTIAAILQGTDFSADCAAVLPRHALICSPLA